MTTVVSTASPKNAFVENIQKWVSIDNQIKLVNEKMKKARELKQQLLDNICEYVKQNDIENTRIEISDGELRFFDKKEYQPISFGYIQTCLEKIISDKKQVDYIINYLKENREVKVSKEIRRTTR
jgi:hypothetical protein